MTYRLPSLVALGAFWSLACSSGSESPVAESQSEAVPRKLSDVVDGPVRGLTHAETRAFNDGDLAFSTPLRAGDGLGPLYTRTSCDGCHADGIRGPGLVQKMALVEADGVTPLADQSLLAWGHTVHPLLAADAVTPIEPPDNAHVKVSTRLGPPVVGRGYMESVLDSEIQRVEKEQSKRKDGIRGRINWVVYASEVAEDASFNPYKKGDLAVGRFGLKSRIATMDEFTADAFQGDMGITSPYRPNEFPNPDGIKDDEKPGVDVGMESVLSRATYLRLLAIPERGVSPLGEALFDEVKCAACHVPSLHTRSDYPIQVFADIDAPVFTDFLLHNMGVELADGLPAGPDTDGEAGPFDWRTAPLIGLRFNRTLMHDGRAKGVAEAIAAHRGEGSEANVSVDLFDALAEKDRDVLVQFVEGL